MKMKKLKFFSSYCSQNQIYKNIISSWSKGSETYKDLLITLGDDYEYAVVFNQALPDKPLPKSKVVGFSHEPRTTLRLNGSIESGIQENVSSYFLSNSEDLLILLSLGIRLFSLQNLEKVNLNRTIIKIE
jgi:hypothetical protein